jgi:hypothetical protein
VSRKRTRRTNRNRRNRRNLIGGGDDSSVGVDTEAYQWTGDYTVDDTGDDTGDYTGDYTVDNTGDNTGNGDDTGDTGNVPLEKTSSDYVNSCGEERDQDSCRWLAANNPQELINLLENMDFPFDHHPGLNALTNGYADDAKTQELFNRVYYDLAAKHRKNVKKAEKAKGKAEEKKRNAEEKAARYEQGNPTPADRLTEFMKQRLRGKSNKEMGDHYRIGEAFSPKMVEHYYKLACEKDNDIYACRWLGAVDPKFLKKLDRSDREKQED